MAEPSTTTLPEPLSSPCKLSLFSLPNQQPEPPGMLTPPLRPPSSIPFLWEEAPGKPRFTTTTTNNNNSVARCLELPPRMLSEPSPTTVLEGPYVRRCSSHSTVFARERLISFEEEKQVGGSGLVSKRRESRGSGVWARKTCKRNTRVCEDTTACVISPSPSSCSVDRCTKSKKITRIRRVGSFFTFSHSHSHHHHLWASIFGSLKQAVPLPWKSRKIKKDGLSL